MYIHIHIDIYTYIPTSRPAFSSRQSFGKTMGKGAPWGWEVTSASFLAFKVLFILMFKVGVNTF